YRAVRGDAALARVGFLPARIFLLRQAREIHPARDLRARRSHHAAAGGPGTAARRPSAEPAHRLSRAEGIADPDRLHDRPPCPGRKRRAPPPWLPPRP